MGSETFDLAYWYVILSGEFSGASLFLVLWYSLMSARSQESWAFQRLLDLWVQNYYP